MVIIRMARGGAKKRPFYKIVVTDKRKARDGKPIERIGFFNPFAKNNEKSISINLERVDYWLKIGAKTSNRVKCLIKSI